MADRIPLDVLFEICGSLESVDILQVSWTCKNWHSIMMSHSSIYLWKDARKRVPGMPDCPDDLNEPQYASLAFGKSCYFCDRTAPDLLIAWEARLRICKGCLDTHFMTKPISPPPKYNVERPYELMRHLPIMYVEKRSGTFKPLSQILRFIVVKRVQNCRICACTKKCLLRGVRRIQCSERPNGMANSIRKKAADYKISC
ncbi:hypothetical protein GALMADRAFT_892175 [Galerina marginata CBS 339.88]|uniref:F-box domain-containing protein n=1 Tax=Galerina marginata (strain CBS 339.88) TaxID=685588 RepID=A0A067SJL3_GALM3|nr:hypothetical protein GALMADRAFT_892175 [Galerina marginata CBS 339.88]